MKKSTISKATANLIVSKFEMRRAILAFKHSELALELADLTADCPGSDEDFACVANIRARNLVLATQNRQLIADEEFYNRFKGTGKKARANRAAWLSGVNLNA